MGAPSKRARKTRVASEFDIDRLRAQFSFPKENNAVYSWSLAEIFNARNAQMTGNFALAARAAESMRTDDALFVAYENRLAPQRCIKVQLVPAKGARGASICGEADASFGQNGVGITPDTVADIHGCLVNHGLAIGYNLPTAREDGSRVDFVHCYWPIEFVRWDAVRRQLMARIDVTMPLPDGMSIGGEVPIVHGDGRWAVYQKGEYQPWKQGAVIAALLVWARHAFATRDWAKSSLAHGLAKVIGALPEGVQLQTDGAASPEAASFMALLLALANSDLPVGIKPSGSDVQFLSNASTNWQVFDKLTENAEKAAARIYLGTDGTLGAGGGAPGVDIQALFGVASTKVEGDLRAIERGVLTGVIEPWCAINFGDSSLAPRRAYLLPDGDADAARASLSTRTAAFYDEVERAKKNGFLVDQAFVAKAASKHGIEAPALPVESNKAPSIALAPTDIARVVTVNEARASAGVGPLSRPDGSPDPDGRLTVEQFAAKAAAPA